MLDPTLLVTKDADGMLLSAKKRQGWWWRVVWPMLVTMGTGCQCWWGWTQVGGNETVIFPFTKTPTTLNFKLLPMNHRVPPSRRLIDNTCHHPFAIHITSLPPIMSQKATTAIPDCHGCTIVPKTPLSGNTQVMLTPSGILKNAVIVL